MERVHEQEGIPSNDAAARRAFLAFAALAVTDLLRNACRAEEEGAGIEQEKNKPSREKLAEHAETKSGVPDVKKENTKKLSEEDMKAAMNRIGELDLDDFREGVDIAGVIIRVPDVKPWGTIIAGEKTWMLRAKHGLAKAFVKDGCTIKDMTWDGEMGELLTVLKADGPLLPRRKKISRKIHPFDKTTQLLLSLCCDDKDIVLSDAEGNVTGVVLTLDPPEDVASEEE